LLKRGQFQLASYLRHLDERKIRRGGFDQSLLEQPVARNLPDLLMEVEISLDRLRNLTLRVGFVHRPLDLLQPAQLPICDSLLGETQSQDLQNRSQAGDFRHLLGRQSEDEPALVVNVPDERLSLELQQGFTDRSAAQLQFLGQFRFVDLFAGLINAVEYGLFEELSYLLPHA